MNSNEENTTEEQKIEETLNKKYVCSFNKLSKFIIILNITTYNKN